MRKSALAIGVAASICLAGTAAPAAFAQSHAKAAKAKVTVSVARPKTGQPVTAHGTGFGSHKSLVCIETLYRKGAKLNEASSYVPSAQTGLKSTAKGKVTCHEAFLPFKATGGGKTRHCPPTKADKKAGWKCGLAIANPSHRSTYAVGVFKF